MKPITINNRDVSYEGVKPSLGQRHKECIEFLDFLGEATANEIAYLMYETNVIPRFDRNYVHPRLNELVKLNKVEVLDKRKDLYTGKTCAVYRLVI